MHRAMELHGVPSPGAEKGRQAGGGPSGLTRDVEGEEGASQRSTEEEPQRQQHEVIHCQRHTDAQGNRQNQGEDEGGTAAKPREESQRQ